jgi:CxxC motif-containing protein (DUF1111 family)
MKAAAYMPAWNSFSLLLLTTVLVASQPAYAQVDPGPRPGAAGAGGPIKNLSAKDEKLFWASWERFKKVYSVSGSIEMGAGLGPSFNGNGCAQCHAQPAAGGSSPGARSPQVRQVQYGANQHLSLAPQFNPQMAMASLDRLPKKEQQVPSFLTKDGPVRVPHLVRHEDGSLDGSTYNIFTVAGRKDAPDCNLAPISFESEMARHNVVFRIPTPIFGAGLIESIPDDELVRNLETTKAQRGSLGIQGEFNRSPNDGTISRFGWKAQNKSLMIFAAESYSVEMGVTSEIFPNKRSSEPGCAPNPLPEDRTRVSAPNDAFSTTSEYASDVVNFASFMRLAAPSLAATHTASEVHGKKLFDQVGCAACHTPRLTTGKSSFTGMSEIVIEPYSDFALHHMGPGLADGVVQGLAEGDAFRSAPLWGLGQRLFFLHDGRTSDLLLAIREHASGGAAKGSSTRRVDGGLRVSEANDVIRNFDALDANGQQDILNFLRSL